MSHYIGQDNSTDVLPGQASSASDASKIKGSLKFNWGNLLKAAPSVLGHVVQIGTTIASVMDVRDGDAPTVATNTMKTSAVPSKTGFYQIIHHDIEGDLQGLAIACYDSASASVQPLVAKYVVPFIKWAKKTQTPSA